MSPKLKEVIRPKTVARFERRRGLSMLELLIAAVVVAVLVGLTSVWILNGREKARRTQCEDRLRGLGTAVQSFVSAKKAFPPAANSNGYSFYVLLLPHIDMQEAFDKLDLNESCYDFRNEEIYFSELKAAKCPAAPVEQVLNLTAPGDPEIKELAPYGAHYVAVLGAKERKAPNALLAKQYEKEREKEKAKNPKAYASNEKRPPPPDKYAFIMYDEKTGGVATNGLMSLNSAVTPKDVKDGLSRTFLLGEASWETKGNRPWMAGSGWLGTWIYSGRNVVFPLNRWSRDDWGTGAHDASLGGRHFNGSNFCMGDGSVFFILTDTDPRVLQSLASRNGGEPDLLKYGTGEAKSE